MITNSGITVVITVLDLRVLHNLKEEKQREAKRTRRSAQSPTPSTERQYPTSHGRICMIQEGRPSKAKQDTYTLQDEAAEGLKIAEIYQLHGAETSITCSQSDHPPVVPRPGHAPLVLDAQIGGYDMNKIFMDGGSNMNIIFVSTLHKMLIPRSVWKKSRPFYTE